MNIVHTNKYNKTLQSPGALNIKETPGHKQKNNTKKNNNSKWKKANLGTKWKWIHNNKKKAFGYGKKVKGMKNIAETYKKN